MIQVNTFEQLIRIENKASFHNRKEVKESMKKGLVVMFGLRMVATLAFTGCQKKEEVAPPAEAPVTEAPAEAPAPEAPAEAPAPEAPAGQ
ncbi:MAG: hypothetical protein HY760_08100 [Nitrospirae bacterium]|nr:hypothetical protein [Nitrospirota bacterium]